jgi:glycosyltransferase involved in cell wall biosynthesis
MEATANPKVSVVIPAYNQAHYLAEAIQSVVNQTFEDYEIIVVDDGSTDDTQLVAQQFEPSIRYIYQDNQGLAGARNTGIQHARGDLIALLDSDDAWLPTFLASMVSLMETKPQAAVCYCGVIYIDSLGRKLPQSGNTRVLSSEVMYDTILRMNFLIPSTIIMKRSVVITASLFDVNFRRLQDWELWVRLLRAGYIFAGLDQCLVRYRLHSDSLSTDPTGGQRAALALAEKHFGIDDGKWQSWPEDKRRAYGGVYRYHALTTALLRQHDWKTCNQYLGRALLIDPTLAVDTDLFYELVLGTQPMGNRGFLEDFDLENSVQNVEQLFEDLFQQFPDLAKREQGRLAYSTLYYALGLIAFNQDRLSLSRRFLLMALRSRPRLWYDKRFLNIVVKSHLGMRIMNLLRRIRNKF